MRFFRRQKNLDSKFFYQTGDSLKKPYFLSAWNVF